METPNEETDDRKPQARIYVGGMGMGVPTLRTSPFVL